MGDGPHRSAISVSYPLASHREQSSPSLQPRSTRLPSPSESCRQAIFVPAAMRGNDFFWVQLVRGESMKSPSSHGHLFSCANPHSVRHPGIKPNRNPQKLQETKHRKTEKGVGQAFLPSLGRHRFPSFLGWAWNIGSPFTCAMAT